MEIQCAEVYSRTLLQCDEATLFQRLASHQGPFGAVVLQTALGINLSAKPSSLSEASVNVLLPCCSLLEHRSGRCKHASGVAELLERRRQFEEQQGEVTRRINQSAANIRLLLVSNETKVPPSE